MLVSLTDIEFHEVSNIFPLMQGEEFKQLVDDIRQHGLREPIWLYRDKIIDGRNRYRACKEAGVIPVVREWDEEGSLIAFVISLNLHRRHLDESQRAMIAAKVANMRQGARTDLEPSANLPEVSQPEAADLLHVSERSVRAAKVVLHTGAPDLIEAVETGDVKVSTAAEIATLPVEEQQEIVARGESEILRQASRIKREKKETRRAERIAKREAIPEDLPTRTERFEVHISAVADLHFLADNSVDCIITDPPYPEEFLPVYEQLSRSAARVLKDGGSCIVMVGQSYLPSLFPALCTHLTYQWCLSYLTPGGQSAQLWARKVNTFWKPLLWFVKGTYSGDWIGDVTKSEPNDNDKRFHWWGQSESGMADIVRRFTKPGEIILDPFCGGGATGVVALDLNRKFIGADIDEDSVKTTLVRLNETSRLSHAA